MPRQGFFATSFAAVCLFFSTYPMLEADMHLPGFPDFVVCSSAGPDITSTTCTTTRRSLVVVPALWSGVRGRPPPILPS